MSSSAHERAAFTAMLTACDCPGCAGDAVRPDCAACGRPAQVAMEGQGHQMSLCGRCLQIVYEVREASARNGAKQEPLCIVWGNPLPRRGAQGTHKTPHRKRAVA